jgi:hypothetical protein
MKRFTTYRRFEGRMSASRQAVVCTGKRVARLKTLARAIEDTAAPALHVGSLGVTAEAVHRRPPCVNECVSTSRSRIAADATATDGDHRGTPAR